MDERKTDPVCVSINKVLLSKADNEAWDRSVSLSQIIGEALCVRYNLDPKQLPNRKLKKPRRSRPIAPVTNTEQDWRHGVDFLYFLWKKGQHFHPFSLKAIKYLDSQGIPTDELPKE